MANPSIRSEEFRGIIPAVVSPHDGHDKFCGDSFVQQIEFLYEQAVHGIYICGGTGEGYSMRLEERKQAMEIASQVSNSRGIVINHVGAQCTRDAIELAEHAARNGAHAIASLPPPGRNHKELLHYYAELARASDLPLFVYYIPEMTGHKMGYDELLQLLDLDGVVGLKFTEANLFLMRRLIDARPETIVFSGFDELLMAALQYGAVGGIGTWYNVVPGAFLAIFDSVKRGDFQTAWKWQHKVIRLADFGWKHGIKATVEHLLRSQGRVVNAFRRPFVPFDSSFAESVSSQLTQILMDFKNH
jgi:N-acetylneuraminate lyase